ncbi:MAG TPA: DUF459 domain-containing protein [Stellaceae bacterium]|nr:DUF459 domain-containing protein [Stellaceae bacterium]
MHLLERLCGAWRGLAPAVVLVVACGGALAASADEPTAPTTIVVFGDSQAAGLARGLQRVLVEDDRYRILNRTHAGAALVHGDKEWLAPVQRFTQAEKADIAIVMLGANDRIDMRGEDGGYLRFRSDDWRAAYAARADKILSLLADAKLKVMWCGNPIARSPAYSEDMSYINDIYAGETAKFGARFVPLWSVVADDQGRYAAYGKDRDGTTERMRADDGIHFTAAGYELIAEKILGLLSSSAAATAPPNPAPAPPAAGAGTAP